MQPSLLDGWMDECLDGWIVGWMVGWIEGRREGKPLGQTHFGFILFPHNKCSCSKIPAQYKSMSSCFSRKSPCFVPAWQANYVSN